MEEKKVYQAINKVQAAISKIGIAKDQKNTQGSGYMFRGIDSVYNVLAPILAENMLCILPRMINRTCAERTSKNGGALFYTTIEAEFDFVSAEDGSIHTVKTFGEAMDSGDKSTNKAMSAAYKYAAFQSFCIPTEGDNDSENHEIESAQLITNDQLIVMNDEISSRGVDIKRLLAFAKVESLEQIDQKNYHQIMTMIKAKPVINKE